MCVYMKIFSKQLDVSLITIWSLFITSLLKAFYSIICSLSDQSILSVNSVQIVICVLVGAMLPILLKCIYMNKIYRKARLKIFNKTIHENIFDDVIDYNKKTMAKVYIKDLDVFYVGTFSLIEEKGNDSYISLIDYALLKNDTFKEVYRGETSSVVFNLNDIDRIEFTYEDDSKIWESLSKKGK